MGSRAWIIWTVIATIECIMNPQRQCFISTPVIFKPILWYKGKPHRRYSTHLHIKCPLHTRQERKLSGNIMQSLHLSWIPLKLKMTYCTISCISAIKSLDYCFLFISVPKAEQIKSFSTRSLMINQDSHTLSHHYKFYHISLDNVYAFKDGTMP